MLQLKIKDVIIQKDNVEEALELLDITLIKKLIKTAFMTNSNTEDKIKAATLAMASYITDSTTIFITDNDVGSLSMFKTLISYIGRQIALEVNEKVPFKIDYFVIYFKSLMLVRFGFLYDNNDTINILITGYENNITPEMLDLVTKYKDVVTSVYLSLKNDD